MRLKLIIMYLLEVDEKNPEYARLKNAGTYLNLQSEVLWSQAKSGRGRRIK